MRGVNILAIMALVLCACSEQSAIQEHKTTETETVVDTKGMVEVDLTNHGLPATMMVPDKNKTGVDPTVMVDDVTNIVEVKCGKNYNVMLREEDMTMDIIKTDLEGDIMFTNEIVKQTDNSILYRQTTPDGGNELFHFASILDNGSTSVYIWSNEMGEYSERQAENMMNSATTFKMNTMVVMTQ